jgi:major membrane immunogen (membrane-anchored lipoprotein)
MKNTSLLASARMRPYLNITFILLFFFGLVACGNKKEVQQTYYNGGKLQQEIEYENGVPNGKMTAYYQNGKIKSTGYFKNGRMDSVSTGYYEDGQVRSVKHYKDGVADGPYQNYHENGNLIASGEYHNGLRTGYAYEYFREYPGKVKKKTYLHNFKGKEEIGYVVTYQPEGQVDEVNPGKVLVKVPGDTLQVGKTAQLEISLAEGDQELQSIIMGGFDEQFEPTNVQKMDTIKADGKKAFIDFTPTQPGLNPVRGSALVKLMSVQSGNTRQITVKPVYFNYPLYAK